jgi:hypothetical protein
MDDRQAYRIKRKSAVYSVGHGVQLQEEQGEIERKAEHR